MQALLYRLGYRVWFFKIQRRGDMLTLQEFDGAAIERFAGVVDEDGMSREQIESVFDLLENETIPLVSVNEVGFEYVRVN